jgi:hypothetical protein
MSFYRPVSERLRLARVQDEGACSNRTGQIEDTNERRRQAALLLREARYWHAIRETTMGKTETGARGGARTDQTATLDRSETLTKPSWLVNESVRSLLWAWATPKIR